MVTKRSVPKSKGCCKDRRKIVFQCDICKTIFEVYKEAVKCESDHFNK